MVGAVLVKGGKIIAQGWHKRFGGDHAEIEAFKRSANKSKGSTLYVTLEPCSHYGKTPPCVDQVIARGVKRVVIAMKDPNPLTNGKSIAKLKRSGIKVETGILKEEAETLNRSFITFISAKRPYTVLKIAQTLDGKTASATGDSKWITSDATRKFSRGERKKFDAILVGINTVLQDDPRLDAPGKKNFKKIVVDTELRIPSKAKVLSNPFQCILATTANAKKDKIKQLKKKGAEVIVCPVKKNRVDLKWLMKELGRRDIGRLLIEGGAHIAGSALKENIVDKIQIYCAPKILGAQKAQTSIVGLNIPLIDRSVRLKDITVRQLNSDILIEGYVHRNR
jgi:diaminohydroxyphosphoribosylaminopyrimidine deaminase/5-amino-6-(5-phosphoribosylamino)uracil reductase